MLSGRYRTDALLSKWSGDSGGCLLPGCSAPNGDLEHMLSGACGPLQGTTAVAISRGLAKLSDFPHLVAPVLSALQNPDISVWVATLLDPSTHPSFIKIQQDLGKKSIWPAFRFSRTVIWSIHRKRLVLKGQERYL